MRKDKKPIPLPNVAITAMSAEGKGVAKIDSKVHFVKGGVPGDVADLLLHKTKSKYAEGEIAQLITPSPKSEQRLSVPILALVVAVSGNISTTLHSSNLSKKQ
jgi:23S rRNA (uracil1939-C5)-methyltransferase